jgi:hypothetical protein
MTTPSPDPTPPRLTGERRRLPATRSGITHKFSIAGFEGYLTANTYDDGSLGELFINDVGKEGSTLRGVLAMFAIATSVALQYGAPPEVLARNTTSPASRSPTRLGRPSSTPRWLKACRCRAISGGLSRRNSSGARRGRSVGSRARPARSRTA